MNSWHDDLDDMSLPENFIVQAEIYSSMLAKYTKTHNITAFKSKYEIYKNIVDSVYPIRYLDFSPKNIADIGSGAGFPGFHLALALPETNVTLYEPIAKKSAFLHWVKAELRVTNLSIKSKRIEDEKDTTYDLIVSRAVTQTKMLLNLCKNIKNQDSSFLLYKGSSVDEELDEELDFKIHTKGDRRYLFIKGEK